MLLRRATYLTLNFLVVGTHILAHARARAQVVVGGDGKGRKEIRGGGWRGGWREGFTEGLSFGVHGWYLI